MTQLPLGHFNHIALVTNHAERAAEFYCRVLGFRVVPRPSFSFDGRWLYREGAGVMIHLIHRDDAEKPKGPLESLNRHFAIQCSDIDAAVAHLEKKKIEYLERKLPDYGYRQIFFRDPDGNLVEIGEWPDVDTMVEEMTEFPVS